MAFIEISGMQKSFGKLEVLKDVSFTVEKGDVVAVIGSSGSGKSTMLRCLINLETVGGGSIAIENRYLVKDGKYPAKKEIKQITSKMGMVFQQFNLFPHLSVRTNLEMPVRLTQKADKKELSTQCEEMLQKVGLSDKIDAYPSQLSGGQKQRVALARALASKPQVLLCDEPTSALDPLTTKSVLELLKDINQKLGVTIIIITHELAVVRSICNRMVVIDNGLFVEQGETAAIFENPQSEVARLLLGKEEV